jgi:hypothetical protein
LHGHDQIGLQSHDLIAVSGNPGAAFDRHGVGLAFGAPPYLFMVLGRSGRWRK